MNVNDFVLETIAEKIATFPKEYDELDIKDYVEENCEQILKADVLHKLLMYIKNKRQLKEDKRQVI